MADTTDSDRQQPPEKRQRTSGESGTNTSSTPEISCAICGIETDNDEFQLLDSHKCPVCSKDAWHICEVCDEALLSRTCPICRSDYAPLILCAALGLPTFPIPTEQLSNRSVIDKIAFLGKIICQSNVAVWDPTSGKMLFSLPQEFTESSSFRSICVTVTIEASQIVDDQFLFTNSFWDVLMQQFEESEDPSEGVKLNSKQTMKKVFSALQQQGSQFFSRIPPEQWREFDTIFGSADSETATGQPTDITGIAAVATAAAQGHDDDGDDGDEDDDEEGEDEYDEEDEEEGEEDEGEEEGEEDAEEGGEEEREEGGDDGNAP